MEHTDTVYRRSRTAAFIALPLLRLSARRIERPNILPINTVLSSGNFKWCHVLPVQGGPRDLIVYTVRPQICTFSLIFHRLVLYLGVGGCRFLSM